jgi:ribosomal protein S18 acetylase RimI-like enzyme
MQFYKDHFGNEDSVYFLATIGNESRGFISFDLTRKIVQTHRLFVKQCNEYDDIVFELLSYSSQQLKSLGKEYFQTFFVTTLNIKEQLEEDGFKVYPRVKMVYDLIGNEIPEHSLDAAYQVEKFTLEKLDEELQIIVEANKGTLDGEIFRQFSDLESVKELFYRGKMDGERLNVNSPILLKDGKIAGVNIIANFNPDQSYVWIIALLPEHRGKGLGKYLMLKAHDNCKKDNVKEMILDVTLGNKAAHGLYTKLGYKETSRYLTVLKKY